MSDKPETLAAILAEMRKAVVPMICGRPKIEAVSIRDVLQWADRIEASAARERRKYERLHECFWSDGAIQNIVRQLLDERDDLRDQNPKASEVAAHFAQLLKEAATRATGNAAAMREALARVVEWADRYVGRLCFHGLSPERDGWRTASHAANDALAQARSALSAPARNCDRFATEDEAREAYWAYREPLEFNNKPFVAITEWLFATEGGKE